MRAHYVELRRERQTGDTDLKDLAIRRHSALHSVDTLGGTIAVVFSNTATGLNSNLPITRSVIHSAVYSLQLPRSVAVNAADGPRQAADARMPFVTLQPPV